MAISKNYFNSTFRSQELSIEYVVLLLKHVKIYLDLLVLTSRQSLKTGIPLPIELENT